MPAKPEGVGKTQDYMDIYKLIDLEALEQI